MVSVLLLSLVFCGCSGGQLTKRFPFKNVGHPQKFVFTLFFGSRKLSHFPMDFIDSNRLITPQ